MTVVLDESQFEHHFAKYFITDTDEEYFIKHLGSDFIQNVRRNLEKVTFKNNPGDVKKNATRLGKRVCTK